MCGRYVIAQKIQTIEKRFNVSSTNETLKKYRPNFNVSPGAEVPIISSDSPGKLTTAVFGLTPAWAKKKMYLFNARAEGDSNKENNPDYAGGKGIIQKPSFRKPIRSQRCLVIADCFIEGTTISGLNEPYLIYLQKRRPFAFAGIWDLWVDNNTGEQLKSFSIITTVANNLLQKIPHHRSPVILSQSQEAMWLNSTTPLEKITAILKPYPSEYMNAYPISKEIKSPKANSLDLIHPSGERLQVESEVVVKKDIKLQGMGGGRRGYEF